MQICDHCGKQLNTFFLKKDLCNVCVKGKPYKYLFMERLPKEIRRAVKGSWFS
jgi:hypothetical protein